MKARFFELSDEECRDLLARQRVGRLAFMAGARVDIQPVGFVLHGDWLFMRSAYGAKLEAIERNPYVAFEVDEAHGPFDWESVVVHGTIYELPPDGGAINRTAFNTAVAALRVVSPDALTSRDPVPERNSVYGLRIDTMTGRTAAADGRGRTPVPAPRASRAPAGRAPDGF